MNDIAFIKLSNRDSFAICDASLLELALAHNTTWFMQDSGVHCRSKIVGDKIALHRLALGEEVTNKYLDVDHRNRVKLDNRKCNLRLCSHNLNLANCEKSKGFTSKHKGVSWHKKAGKWMVMVTAKRKRYYGGLYEDENTAGIKANKLMTKLYGEFACLNILDHA